MLCCIFLVHLVHVGAHLFTLNLRREGDLTAEMVCEELQSKHLKDNSGPRVRHHFNRNPNQKKK